MKMICLGNENQLQQESPICSHTLHCSSGTLSGRRGMLKLRTPAFYCVEWELEKKVGDWEAYFPWVLRASEQYFSGHNHKRRQSFSRNTDQSFANLDQLYPYQVPKIMKSECDDVLAKITNSLEKTCDSYIGQKCKKRFCLLTNTSTFHINMNSCFCRSRNVSLIKVHRSNSFKHVCAIESWNYFVL